MTDEIDAAFADLEAELARSVRWYEACQQARWDVGRAVDDAGVPAALIVSEIVRPLIGLAMRRAMEMRDAEFRAYVAELEKLTALLIRDYAGERGNLRWQKALPMLAAFLEREDFVWSVEDDLNAIEEA